MTGRGAAGFTLIEVLVVLVILGLMAELVIARGPARSAGVDARAASNVLAGSLRVARSEAIVTDRPVLVTIDGPSGSVRVGKAASRRLSAVLIPPAHPIVFAPDGSSSGGSIGVVAGTVRYAVSVEWLTGRISIAAAQ